jgi:hypothetical protein
MRTTVGHKAPKQNAAASPKTGFVAHGVYPEGYRRVRPNASHFAKPEPVERKCRSAHGAGSIR